MDRYEMIDGYTMKDYKKSLVYTTGVSLADCTIPFVKLLNRLNSYWEFCREERDELEKKNERLQRKINDYESLLGRFEELYGSTVEAMIQAEEEDY